MTNKIEPVAWLINWFDKKEPLLTNHQADVNTAQKNNFKTVPLYALPEGSKILSAEQVEQVREALRKSHTLIENNGMDGDFILAAIQILEE